MIITTVAPVILEVRKPNGVVDPDKVNVCVDSSDYEIWFKDPSILLRNDGTPVNNPEPLTQGDNIFKRAKANTTQQTKCCTTLKTSSPPQAIEYIHPIPPRP